jgi:hypothetical protein
MARAHRCARLSHKDEGRSAGTPSRTPFPVADQGPRAAHVHDAEADKPQHRADGRDELRDVFGIVEQLLNSVFQ